MSLPVPTAEDPTVTVVCDDALARRDPFVSVCIVTYEQEDYIREALDSVLAQETDFAYEVIVGDDCSTDATRAILERYQREHPERIRLHLHEEHYEGIPAKKNMVTNLEAARGRYVALLDGDDYWISPDKLQQQADLMEARPEVSFAFHNAEVVPDGEEASDHFGETDKYVMSERYSALMSQDGDFSLQDLIGWNRDDHSFKVPASSLMFRRQLFTPVPDWFWEMWTADKALEIYLAKQGPAYYHCDLMSCRRLAPTSMHMIKGNTLKHTRWKIREMELICEISPYYRRQISGVLSAQYLQRMRYWIEKGAFPRAAYCLVRALPHYVRIRANQATRALRTTLLRMLP